MKIVIVDPDYIHNFLVVRAFTKLGYCDCFEFCANAKQAKEFCESYSEPYAILFCQNEYSKILNSVIDKAGYSLCMFNTYVQEEMIQDLGPREVYFIDKPFAEEKMKYLMHNFKQKVM